VKSDVASYVGAVIREVDSREHEGRLARVVVATRTYDTTIEDVWDALTNAERIPRWFLPISGDLRLSGNYQLQGNAGGEITRCEPPRLFAVTWVMNGPVSWLTVSLASDPAGGTRLELAHVAHVEDEWWDRFGPGAMGTGWDWALMGLGRHLATGTQSTGARLWPGPHPRRVGNSYAKAATNGARLRSELVQARPQPKRRRRGPPPSMVASTRTKAVADARVRRSRGSGAPAHIGTACWR
jgi:uncharacterized protein YndB with AHSA1/START domain